ncbi:hypothetical protein A4H97_09435 [Niastella yeongjuensis]|uniref:Uncharacterized protein n=1 Tax=Niastella yeongjuensis TaxID=354355 RepID=A0A1V9EEN1_9BACT|nr:hypothetical protein [Niastella yeongjuensis]OQP44580.1 hypothetical protein A4H97_09435 [Niastella yeongjuensis]SEO82557.1 hypothetical protein SAMN05660816_03657 [Niastella yeongjuensis]
MKWTLISNASTGIKEYHLVNDEVVLAVMKYSPEQQSVRISYEEERLVFFMESNGNASRIIFKNVYGVDQGKFAHHNHNNTGRLEINKQIFDYHIVDNNQPKLIIHQHNKQEPLAVCQIPASPTRHDSYFEQAGMVLGSCWFANMPAAPKLQGLLK